MGPPTREVLDGMIADVLAIYKGPMAVQPDVLVVSAAIYPVAKRELNKRAIKSTANHTLWEYEGERWWQRDWPIGGYGRSWPRFVDMGWSTGPEVVVNNRHWRKRGYPTEMEWRG